MAKELTGKFIIISNPQTLPIMDFMKDIHSNLCVYDTEEEALLVCGMYEFLDALVCEVKYRHLDTE